MLANSNKFYILFAFMLIFVLACLIIIVLIYGKNISGNYASYTLFGHDINDTLEFNNGVVTLRTCCGDESWGRYTVESDSTVTWNYKNEKVEKIIKIKVGYFRITLSTFDVGNVKRVMSIRRKLTKSWYI